MVGDLQPERLVMTGYDKNHNGFLNIIFYKNMGRASVFVMNAFLAFTSEMTSIITNNIATRTLGETRENGMWE